MEQSRNRQNTLHDQWWYKNCLCTIEIKENKTLKKQQNKSVLKRLFYLTGTLQR